LSPNPSDLGPGLRKASDGSRCSRRRQQVAAGGSKQAAVESKQGSLHGKMRDKCQNGEKCEVRLSLLWHSVARGRQQEKSHSQVGSARASPLAFSPVSSQPRHFSDFQKNV